MFRWFKNKTKKNPEKNRYVTFDDFIRMMLECSDEQFESNCLWLRSMRGTKL